MVLHSAIDIHTCSGFQASHFSNSKKQDTHYFAQFFEDRPVLYGAPLSPAWEKSGNEENDYNQYIWVCFNKWPVHVLHAR